MKWVLAGWFLQIPVVISLFSQLPVRVAATIAGALFCALGLWLFILGIVDGRWRQGLAFWVNIPFLFLFSVPIWLMSLTQTGRGLVHWDLGGYPFFFVPVQVLHQYANYFFRAVVVLLVFDMVRFHWIGRKKGVKAPS